VDPLGDRHQFVRIRRWQVAKEYAVDHGEEARVDADAQRQGQHGGSGECRIPAERAKAVVDVLPPRVPRPEPDFSCLLTGQQDVADRPVACVGGLLRRQPFACQVRRPQ
jgi:hypothetical protein